MSTPEFPQVDIDQSPFEPKVVYTVPELQTEEGAKRVLTWLHPRIHFPVEDGWSCKMAHINDEKTGVTFSVPLKGSFYLPIEQDRKYILHGGLPALSANPVMEYDYPNAKRRSSAPEGRIVGYEIEACLWDTEDSKQTATLDFANMQPLETNGLHIVPTLNEQGVCAAIDAALLTGDSSLKIR